MQHIEGAVTRYPYRTARVDDVFLQVSRDAMRDFEQQLAEKAGASPSNHTVYEIVQENRAPVYVMFSDYSVRFGTSVLKGRW